MAKCLSTERRKKNMDMTKSEKINKQEQNMSQQEAKNKEKEEEKKVETEKKSVEKEETDTTEENCQELLKKYNELNDKYIRLAAEYDNYRKRTMKEKMDLIKNGGADVLENLLPVIDNFDRALKAIEESSDIDSVKEGIELIHKNFMDFLAQRGVKEIEALGKELDTDLHEAVAQMPAQDEESKGKIIDVIQKGYMLNDKVLRFAKVVVAQ